MIERDNENLEIELLIQAIFMKYQFDFRHYSRSSLRRRLQQALFSFHCHSITDLQYKVLYESDFFPKLIPYLTVNTTEMFRDPSYFKSIRENVVPYLETFPSFKIWIAGCSTGEEVYSMAILLREMNIKKYLIYATDINPLNIEASKKGIYNIDTVKKASQNYLLAGGKSSFSNYFEMAYYSAKIDPSLLQNVVFSDHSLSTDSVFSEMHLISCRNVLIYFDRQLQDRVLNLFKDSLVRGGLLGLGSKETIQFSSVKNDFDVIDNENRIYQKKRNSL